MNELFAVDPSVCKNIKDLKNLMNSFGPYAGRYLANYPTNWLKLVEKQYEFSGQLEAEKAKTILRRAEETLKVVTRSGLLWDVDKNWIQNICELTKYDINIFNSIVSHENRPPRITQIEDFELPPTAEENIEGIESEYVRVCKVLLFYSPEIILVDPYINPTKRQYKSVLTGLFKIAAKGKCQRIVIWSRASETTVFLDVKETLQKIVNQVEFKPGREVEMIFVEDGSCKSKMHGRYLLSIKGGVRLDQGFQQLSEGRRVDVGPVGMSTHVDLLKIYLESEHDMRIIQRFTVKA